MTASVPASPFPRRPSPSPSPSTSSSESTIHATSPPPPPPPPLVTSAHRVAVEFPLTSFASTPHNVACIAFVLGAVWSLGVSHVVRSDLSTWFSWSSTQLPTLPSSASAFPRGGWTTAWTSPQLGLYLASWALFHLLEFVVTSMWNPGKLSVSSYLLDNGKEYMIAHLAGVTEYVLEETFLPDRYRAYKHLGGLTLVGVGLVAGGQVLRSFAMISASSNFSHLISFNKLPNHQLVTSGIYSWSRHPSYAGFYWWAIGTQVALGNPICTIAFVGALQYFFAIRIRGQSNFVIYSSAGFGVPSFGLADIST
ncbi:hypothetical protein JCM10212_006513, partial [Sporobolomyces blumeae]